MQVDNDIRLKELELLDAQLIFDTIDAERDYLREWLPFVDETHKVEDSLTFVKNMIKNGKHKNEYTYTIIYHGVFAGLVGFRDTDHEDKKTELGYWLSEKFQKKGIVIRSCAKLIDHAFTELDMNRIQIKVATHNYKSQQIPIKLGFREEGIERDGEMLFNGFTDLIVYSLLLSEYKNKKE
jgi:ribosomal-protein-serine acetyltransferase